MPARILRATLRESQRFLDLPDNDCRIAFLFAVLEADDFGNLEAAPGALRRLWRDLNVATTDAVARVAQALEGADLLRFYEIDGKRYAHIPRFRQRVRHERRAHPRPPNDIDDYNKINDDDQKTTDDRQTREGRQTDARQTHVGVREVKRSEVKRSDLKRSEGAREPLPVDNSIAPTPKTQPPQGFFEKLKLEIPTLAKPPTEPSVDEPEPTPAAARRINGHAVKPLAALTKGNWKANQVSIAAVAAQLEFRPNAGETFAQLAERCDREITRRRKEASP